MLNKKKLIVVFVVLSALSVLVSACVVAENATFVPGNSGSRSAKTLAASGIRSLSIETRDGETLHAIHLPDPESEILTIYFHGNGGNIHGRIPALEKLQSIGSSVLGVSYRGYLNSTGVTTEQGIFEDARAALQYGVDVLGFEEKKILVFGRSLGSAVAIDLAQGKDLFGVVLVSPFTNASAVFDGAGPVLRLLIKDENNFINTSFRNLEKAVNISAYTVVIHGVGDSLIPFELGEQIFNALPGHKELVPIEGADHNDFGYRESSDIDKIYWNAVRAVYTR